MKLHKTCLFILLLFPLRSFATIQNGIGFEMGVGYPQVQISDNGQRALYSGVGVQGNVLFPLLKHGLFSTDLEFNYTYFSLENNNTLGASKEWSHYSAFGTGFRFNLSYLFAGINYSMAKGENIQSNSSISVFEYKFNPYVWQVGVALPLSPVVALVVGYSGNFNGSIDVPSGNLTFNEETLWLRLQIDFGLSFINILSPKNSFEKTRDSYFKLGVPRDEL